MKISAANQWKLSAACAETNSDLFFPTSNSKAAAAEALAICASCPVIAECLAYALDLDIREGVWGGKIAVQRAYMRPRATQPGNGLTREQVAHGSDRGAQWHRRHGERPCDSCAQAERLYTAEKARRRTQRRQYERQIVNR